eukprot:5484621-Alexandrium_andersonii.AAC.1
MVARTSRRLADKASRAAPRSTARPRVASRCGRRHAWPRARLRPSGGPPPERRRLAWAAAA